MVKMERSKHNEKMRKQVVKAGLCGYFKMVEGEILWVSKVNRLEDEGKKERELKKLYGPTEWL